MEQNAIDEWYEVPSCPSQIKEKRGGGGGGGNKQNTFENIRRNQKQNKTKKSRTLLFLVVLKLYGL